MPHGQSKNSAASTAKLLVVLLAFAWGLNWVAAAIALREVAPWSLRFAGAGIGAASLALSGTGAGCAGRARRDLLGDDAAAGAATDAHDAFGSIGARER